VTAVLNAALAGFILFLLSRAGQILHPLDPIGQSTAPAIRQNPLVPAAVVLRRQCNCRRTEAVNQHGKRYRVSSVVLRVLCVLAAAQIARGWYGLRVARQPR
jgi:hypothetical protein